MGRWFARMSNHPQLQPTASVEKLAYNTRELSQALGLSTVTLWRLTNRGLLRPIEGLRHKLYSKKEVERFLAGRAA